MRIKTMWVVVVLLITGCSQHHSKQTASGDSGTSELQAESLGLMPLRAETDDRVRLLSQQDWQVGANGELDFGLLPAGQFMPNMKFMSPVYASTMFIENRQRDVLRVQSIEFGQLSTSEQTNPFSTCGVSFEPYALPPGDALGFVVCYHPATTTKSSVVVQVLGENGDLLAKVLVRGQGRDLGKGEAVPMGLMAPDPTVDKQGAAHVELRDGRMIETRTGKDLTNKIPKHRFKEKAGCVVEIIGGGEIPDPDVSAVHPGTTAINTANIGMNEGVAGDEINVGQHVILDVAIICPFGTSPLPSAILWEINGDHIKDYNEGIRTNTTTPIPMTAADLIVTPRDLYWKNTGTHRVKAKVDYTWNGLPTTATVQRDFVVERNNQDVNRQMEDFYVWNHEAEILKSHFSWHPLNPSGRCRSQGGRDFFEFHRQMLGSANGFRTLFGYPLITMWDGTQALPVGVDVQHANRAPRNIPFQTPTWYTRFGTRLISPCVRVRKLSDFRTARELAVEMEGAWHGTGHVNVGGTMLTYNSPKDPIFYRWHRAIDFVYHNWLNP